MADIAPFRGVHYDPKRVDLSKVLSPPYDVIDPAQRAELAAADPHNSVRLILPEAEGGGDKYAEAARLFSEWQASGLLVRDERRAVYRYHQVFRSAELGDRLITRKGLIAGVRIEPYSAGVILPHERTLAGPKRDRYELMKATHAHFSQIFTLFRDPAGEIDRLFKKTDGRAPDLEGQTADGVIHRLWRVSDAELIGDLRRRFAPLSLYIADGHHRYETMAAIRDEVFAAEGELSHYSSARFATVFLVAADDPGLVVLPTHRVLFGMTALSPTGLAERATAYFDVERLPGAGRDLDQLRRAGAEGPHQPGFVMIAAGEADAWRFTLSPRVNLDAVGVKGHPAVQRLDVTVLHRLLFEKILGITPAEQEAQTHLRYFKDTAATVAEIAAGRGQAAFLVKAARVDQVMDVADAGEVMPQKSTFFYPKLASCLVMQKLDRDEDLM